MEAAKTWLAIPKEVRREILQNTFCSKCFVTEMEKFTIHLDDDRLILDGQCKQCKAKVRRVVD